jgi:Zn-dependent protease with chaperone function
VLNAYTFGTDEEAFIVIHSAMIDHYDPDELKFVIGHETGHIQNKHVIYNTVLLLLKNTAVAMLRLILPPIEIALNAWYRRAEITCDRAGLLCTGDLESGTRALLKLACGSTKLYDELDVEAYLEQFDEGRDGVGRFTELFASHPFLTKRIHALRAFAKSDVYRQAMGLGEGGMSMEDVDRETSEIIQILKGNGDKRGEGSDL